MLGGCSPLVYACVDEQDCASGDGAGFCEPTGFCSFSDSECASGRRYGSLAGGGLAGACTDATEDGSTSTDLSSSSASTEPKSDDSDASSSTGGLPTPIDMTTGGADETSGAESSTGSSEPDDALLIHLTFDVPPSEDGAYPPTESGLVPVCESFEQCPTPVFGVDGFGAHFDGVDDRIMIADSGLLHPTEGLTLSAWIRPSTKMANAPLGMVVGKGGRVLKQVGTAARHDLNEHLGERVHLELWVKVKDNWADNEQDLLRLGFESP